MVRYYLKEVELGIKSSLFVPTHHNYGEDRVNYCIGSEFSFNSNFFLKRSLFVNLFFYYNIL